MTRRTPTFSFRKVLYPLFILAILAEAIQTNVLRIPLIRNNSAVETAGLETSSIRSLQRMGALNYQNTQYFARLYIGPQRQAFRILFDTGSGWFWIKDRNCKSCEGKVYDCTNSDSCKYTDFGKVINYGVGSVTGIGFSEALAFDKSGSTAFNHAGLILQDMQDLGNFKGDGLIGLGFTSVSAGYDSFLDSLLKAGVIKKRTFSIYLSDNPNSEGVLDSELIFGGYDPKYVHPEDLLAFRKEQHPDPFVYTHKVKEDFWTIKMENFHVGSKLVHLVTTDTLIDSGTSDLLIPTEEFFDVTKAINEATKAKCKFESEPFVCEGAKIDAFPSLKFTFGGKAFELPPKSYVSCSKGLCQMHIGISTSGRWVLGQVFMRQFYTIFDQDNNRIGLVRAADLAKRQNFIFPVGFAIIGLVALISLAVSINVYRKSMKRVEKAPNEEALLPK